MNKKLQQVRKRLYDDFAFYSKSALKIRTKAGEIAPLKLNAAQQILHDAVTKQIEAEGKVRVIILKARQQGLSTYVGGYLYHSVSQQKAKKAMVLSHLSDSTRALFDMTRGIMKTVPRYLGRTPNTQAEESCLSMFLTQVSSLRQRAVKVWAEVKRSLTSMRRS